MAVLYDLSNALRSAKVYGILKQIRYDKETIINVYDNLLSINSDSSIYINLDINQVAVSSPFKIKIIFHTFIWFRNRGC